VDEDSKSRRVAAENGRKNLWLAALAAGLIAGAASGAVGEAAADWFPKPKAADPMKFAPDVGPVYAAIVKNAALACALQGAALGLALGVAGGLAASRPGAGAAAGLIGLVLGALVGGGAGFGAGSAYFALSEQSDSDVLASMLAHAAAWSPAGAVGGLAFGLGLSLRGGAARTALGGLLGAAVGAGAYDLVGSAFLALSDTGEPIASTTAARLLAHGAAAVFSAVGAGVFAQASGRRAA
jgi:hypothetical protein